MNARCLLLLFFLPIMSWAAPQERFALVIGSNIGDIGDEPLRFAEEDAAKMASILTRFGAVPEENLVLLQGRSADRASEAFTALTARIQAAHHQDKETMLFVYYSGHADVTAMHLGRTRLEFERMTTLLEDAGATLKVLVVDACRSGELTRVKGGTPVEPFKIVSTERLKSEGNAIITSSAAGEDAQESDRLGGGVFSHHFMTGLRGAADRSGDQRVSLSEAYRYAYDETLRTTSRARFLQHPTYAFRMKGREDLILTRLTDDTGLGRVRLNGSGTWLFLHQSNPMGGVMEVTAQKKSEVIMNPGRYTLRLRTSTSVYEGQLKVVAGETRSVTRSALALVPYGRTIRKGYRGERTAFGLTASSIFAGAMTDGVGPNFGGSIGLRMDFKAFSLEMRGRGLLSESTNSDLSLEQKSFGGDLTALKLFDPGYLSPGFGLRVGVDWVQQSFDTRGRSPDRSAVTPRVAPIMRLEAPISAQVSLALSGFLDGIIIQDEGGQTLVAVPGAEIGLTAVFQ